MRARGRLLGRNRTGHDARRTALRSRTSLQLLCAPPLLCAAGFGAMGGLLVAVPYFLAWLIHMAAQGSGQPSCGAGEDSPGKVDQ